ncbi:hypothetical protein ASPSYDRAFT_142555 [Aspergillus sydowii CBS 593.65]|uniref:Major facilitator superfamily (MFS) profile domain-containing protein n=1 Tax=Aspergillus sydowii CBS 593.65 TaxID=1036612 RepID=A0A1L9U082_9EURO|nr:uncharacterized protein ASPSYDRAFT_142555 [Aspergillus sydowii CBS 593.65]OJJ65065.1 hypothetical protein ASPSYDRAFT_142555 [Aspergillus sydowii CBS 593.65]
MTGPPQAGSCRSCQQHEGELTDSTPIPWGFEFRSSKAFVTWVVAIAVFTDVFIYGMIIPILPEVLQTRVSIPEDESFGGAIFIGSPIFGYFADKSSSRQAPFLIGLFALAASTVMFWFAHRVSALVIARTFQGLSCAVVWTVGMALIVDTMGKDQAGYHAVFAMAIALIVVDIVLRLVMIERKTAAKWIDVQSEIAGTEAEAETERLIAPATEYVSSYEGVESEHSSQQQSNGKTADEQPNPNRRSMPGIVRLMGSLTILVVLQATLVEAMTYSSFDSVLPLYVRSTFDMDPMGIGLCFIPLFVPSFFSTIIGSAVDRYGSRRIAWMGFILDVPALLLLQVVTENTTRDQIVLYMLLFVSGLAAALKTVSLMVEISHTVEEKEKKCPGIFGDKGGTAQAYGLFNVAWSGGQVLGPLVSGGLVDWVGWKYMVSTLAVVSGVTAVVLVATAKGVRR